MMQPCILVWKKEIHVLVKKVEISFSASLYLFNKFILFLFGLSIIEGYKTQQKS